MGMKVLRYEGNNFFRQRLTLATLSMTEVRITNIRSKSESPGLTEFEIGLIRLLEQITNGSKIQINETGTAVRYQPGILVGGTVEYDCGVERGIGYFLEMLLSLAPFCKNPVKAVLTGITDCNMDPSVDFLKSTSLPLMIKFGIRDEVKLEVQKRSVGPLGGGKATFYCPTVKKLRPVNIIEQGKVKKIRGVAYSVRLSPEMANRLVRSARSVLNKFIPDIYIYTDHRKNHQSGISPGFGISLVAETTTGTFLASEICSDRKVGGRTADPEDLGINAANMLLDEICKGGCIGSVNQSLAALLMVLGEQNVVKTLVGPLTNYTIEFLRHIKDFFDVKFLLKSHNVDHEEQGNKVGSSKVLLTCVGVGFSNIAKTTI